MRVKRRKATLIVSSFLITTLAVVSCGLLVTSAQMAAGLFNGPTETVQLNSSEFVLEPVEIERNNTPPAWLGITGYTLAPGMAKVMGLPDTQTGVLVQFIEYDSPAQEAGLQGSNRYVTVDDNYWLVGGDVIIALNDTSITSMRGLLAALDKMQPDEEITITILRDGEQLELTTTLEELPLPDFDNSRPGLRIT